MLIKPTIRRTITVAAPQEAFERLGRMGGRLEVPIKTDWPELEATGKETFILVLEVQRPSSLRPA